MYLVQYHSPTLLVCPRSREFGFRQQPERLVVKLLTSGIVSVLVRTLGYEHPPPHRLGHLICCVLLEEAKETCKGTITGTLGRVARHSVQSILCTCMRPYNYIISKRCYHLKKKKRVSEEIKRITLHLVLLIASYYYSESHKWRLLANIHSHEVELECLVHVHNLTQGRMAHGEDGSSPRGVLIWDCFRCPIPQSDGSSFFASLSTCFIIAGVLDQ